MSDQPIPQQEVDPVRGLAKELAWALQEITATVRGECPSLLDEDSGGSAELSIRIDELLASYRAWKEGGGSDSAAAPGRSGASTPPIALKSSSGPDGHGAFHVSLTFETLPEARLAQRMFMGPDVTAPPPPAGVDRPETEGEAARTREEAARAVREVLSTLHVVKNDGDPRHLTLLADNLDYRLADALLAQQKGRG